MAASRSRDGSATELASQPAAIAFVDLAAQQARIRDRIDLAIRRVLDHGQYIMGPEVAALEARLAAFTGARHAISCASGTDALLIAMMALGVGRGDAVLCPAFTYTATPETIALLGATPVFVDVEAETFVVAPGALEAGLQAARAHGLRAAGIIAVDLFGLPADYAALEPFARDKGLFLLCDAAQSFGAALGGRRVRDIRCDHRIQAAILIEKLAIFGDEIQRREAVARRYGEALDGLAQVPRMPQEAHSVWAQFTIRVAPARRARIMAELKADGVPTTR